MAGEVIASVVERLNLSLLKSKLQRVTLLDCLVPTSSFLEKGYYLSVAKVIDRAKYLLS